eukprot:COSAG01_NODE_8282_length_2845_cov_6.455572_2_plen_336_part_00
MLRIGPNLRPAYTRGPAGSKPSLQQPSQPKRTCSSRAARARSGIAVDVFAHHYSMVTTALFIVLNAWAHTNTTLAGHRQLQAGCGNIFTRVSEVNTACCSSGGGHRRMQTSSCTPTTCSSSCATVFVPFLDDCASNLQAAGQDLNPFFGLYFSCRQATPSAGCAACGAPSPTPPGHEPEPEPEPEPLPVSCPSIPPFHCPVGATAVQNSTYCSDLAGVCHGPCGPGGPPGGQGGCDGTRDLVNVNGKINAAGPHAQVRTRADCQAACDATPACVGYAFSPIRASFGMCVIYGPGVEHDLADGWLASCRGERCSNTIDHAYLVDTGMVCVAKVGRN